MPYRYRMLPHLALWVSLFPMAQVFTRAELPCSDSGIAYLLRAVQLHLNLVGGRPLLAWAPDLMHGYGYPLFGFYAPLSNWFIELLHLAGLDFAPAVRLTFVATLLLAAYGARAMTAADFGEPAGIVSGIAYAYAPYLLFDAIQRGGLPELTAFAFAPWAIHFARRAASHADLRDGALATLSMSAVVLSHNMVPILLAPFIALVGIAPATTGSDSGARLRRRLGTGAGVVLAAVALTAFFWLPAYAELKYAQTWRGLAVHNQDYRNNLLPPDQLATLPPLPADPDGLLNPPIVRTMGIAALAASAAALITLPWQSNRARRLTGYYAAMLLVFFALTTDYSRRIWETVPGMIWFQLPTRFLGLASLGAAGLTGALVERLARLQRPGEATCGVLAAGLIFNGLPWTYAQYCRTPERATARDIAAYTRFPLLMTAEGSPEFLPIWVSEIPDTADFAAEYEAGRTPMRFDLSALPPGAHARAVGIRPAHETWEVDSPTAWTAVYRSFYFPGWTATLDGKPLPIRVTFPHGLMALDVPAGAHTLEIRFGSTPVRVAAAGLSALAALTLAAAVRVQRFRRAGNAPNPAADRRPAQPVVGILAAVVGVGILKVVYLDRAANPLHRYRLAGAQLYGVEFPTQVNFGDELLHLGYDLSRASVRAGEQVEITQYWTPLRPIGLPYGMSVRLADEAGQVWNAPETPRPFGYADYPGTESWPPDRYARDAFLLRVLPGTPPGHYWIEAGAFRRDVPLALVPKDVPTGPDPAQARVGRLRVTRGRGAVNEDNALVEQWADVRVLPALALGGWSTAPKQVDAGTPVHVELLWHSLGASSDSVFMGRLVLAGSDGEAAEALGFTLGGQGYPSSAWQSGEWVRDQIEWRMPADVPAGTYQIEVSVAGSAPVRLGRLEVSAPARAFTPPAGIEPMAVDFGGFARLAGFAITPGPRLRLTLVWLATAETAISYRVFAHVLNEAGEILAQSDGVPAEWTRPTTGWLPGEYIADRREISLPPDLPAGEYEIRVGLYDPITAERAPTASGADSAPVATILLGG